MVGYPLKSENSVARHSRRSRPGQVVPELRSGLGLVTVTAEWLNVRVRVLAPERERLHVVHVREDERSAPGTAGTTTDTDQGTEPSGPLPSTQDVRESGKGPRGLRGGGTIRWDIRRGYLRTVWQSWREINQHDSSSVSRITQPLDTAARHLRSTLRIVARRIGPDGPTLRIAWEVRVIPVRSGVESVNGHGQSVPET
jgi:hypothetical protein